jgi:hypothetical protein
MSDLRLSVPIEMPCFQSVPSAASESASESANDVSPVTSANEPQVPVLILSAPPSVHQPLGVLVKPVAPAGYDMVPIIHYRTVSDAPAL